LKKFFITIFCLPVYFYKFLISPLLPSVCRFVPSCSTYFLQAAKEFGIFKGTTLGIKRIIRCNPKCKKCGYDPVPQKFTFKHQECTTYENDEDKEILGE